jgi:hypothetical protein
MLPLPRLGEESIFIPCNNSCHNETAEIFIKNLEEKIQLKKKSKSGSKLPTPMIEKKEKIGNGNGNILEWYQKENQVPKTPSLQGFS